MKKRGLSILLAFCMVLALLPTLGTQANAATGGHTQAEAVAWAQSQNGASLDYDGVYGAQCVDLIKYYYAYLGDNAGYARGNANEYASNALPSGWTRVYGDYQPGDVAVFKTNYNDYNDNGSLIMGTGSLGHVSIITAVNGGWFTSMNQNHAGHSYCESKTFHTAALQCAIRPDFPSDFNPDYNSLPSNYYGTLSQVSPTKHFTVKNNNVELSARNTYDDPKQLWHYIEQSDGSYKIINEFNGYVLSLENGSVSSGSNAILAPDGGSAAQRWYIHDNGDSTFVITPKLNADLALDVYGGATDVAGTNVQIWTRHGYENQRLTPYNIAQEGVEYVKPSRPAASSVTTTEAIVGMSVSIDWTESALVNRWDARTYTLTVKDSSGAVVLNETGLTDTSYPYTFPSAGAYTAQVTAVNTKYYDYQTVGSVKTISVSTPCEANGHVWDEGVVTQKPTATAEGVKTYTCTVCGATRTEAIPKQGNPFTDVSAGKFFYEPVLWAISQNPQITTGVTATTFEPDRTCTRAHVVTFLWRANGCPEPTNLTSNFKDVKDTSKYYYKAVLWAAEQGITTGYSDGTFRPDDECTRGQVVTFLWRAKGQPTPSSAAIPFTDVPAGKYYTLAVLWALQNNITQGRTASTFGPDDACTRGHVVTFLYRAYA